MSSKKNRKTQKHQNKTKLEIKVLKKTQKQTANGKKRKLCKKSRFLFCDNIHKLTTVIEYNNYMAPNILLSSCQLN